MASAVVLIWYRPVNKILAVTRIGTTDQWGLPGGKIEPREQPIDAARRELEEETGFVTNDLTIVYAGRRKTEKIVIVYQVSPFGAELFYNTRLRQQPGEGIVGWVSPDELVAGPFGEYNRTLFDELGIPYGDTQGVVPVSSTMAT